MKKLYQIISDQDHADQFQRVAELFRQQVETYLLERKELAIGIVGGKSIGSLIKALGQLQNIPWHCLHFFMADERLVPIDHPDSNFGQLQHQIPLSMKGIQWHPFIHNGNNTPLAIKDYGQELNSISDRFDILILSAGEDGHVASLFPEHPSICNNTSGFILVEDAPKKPPKRMSASKNLLATSRCGFLFFMGYKKKVAWDVFTAPDTDLIHCPGKLIEYIAASWLITDL